MVKDRAAFIGHHARFDPPAEGPLGRLADHRIGFSGRRRQCGKTRRIRLIAQGDRR
jgi:hypothetical protein